MEKNNMVDSLLKIDEWAEKLPNCDEKKDLQTIIAQELIKFIRIESENKFEISKVPMFNNNKFDDRIQYTKDKLNELNVEYAVKTLNGKPTGEFIIKQNMNTILYNCNNGEIKTNDRTISWKGFKNLCRLIKRR